MASNEKQPVSFDIPWESSPRTFTEALREKYLLADDGVNDEENSFVIKIDIRGKPKDTSRGSAELGYLRNVVLNENAITHAGLPKDGLKYICPNVVDLDISSNMLRDWKEIITITSSLPHLKYVNLSGNILRKNKDALQKDDRPLPGIENLVLNQTDISWSEISALCRRLPCLRELHICKNGLKEIPADCIDFLDNIDCLRMNDNRFKRWEEIWKLAPLPKLKSLIISGNAIQNIFHVPDDFNVCTRCKKAEKAETTDLPKETGKTSIGDDQVLNTEAGATSSGDQSDPQSNDSDNIDSDRGMHVSNNASECSNPYVIKTAAAVCQNIINEVLERVCQRRHSINTDTVRSVENSDMEMYVSAVTNMMDSRILIGCPGSSTLRNPHPTPGDAHSPNTSGGMMPDIDGHAHALGQEESSVIKAMCQTGDENTKSEREEEHTCDTVPAFSFLESLCASQNQIKNIEDIESLSNYPSLRSLRIKNTRVAPDLTDEDRRKLFVACLPNISVLNGSEVSPDERNKSERYFLRYYRNVDSRPKSYEILYNKHGEVGDYAVVDLTISEWAEITIVYDNTPVQTSTVRVVEPVGKLRKMIAEQVLCIPKRSFRMYHFACGPCHPEDRETTFDELILDGLPLSRFEVMHGDEIHVELVEHDAKRVDDLFSMVENRSTIQK